MKTYNPYSLANKTILVTGASSGIGRSTAIECSKLGAQLIITGRDSDRLQETLTQLEGEHHRFIICDITDRGQILSLVEALPELHGLVNNAGISKLATIGHIKENEFQDILQTNTIAPVMLLNSLIKSKKLIKGSSVVFTSSIAGVFRSSIANSLYSTSKAAVHGFVRNAALELASKKIRVNSVSPAMIETDLIGKSGFITEEQYEKDKLSYPLKRYGKPEEVAHAIIYLLSDAASWVTGTTMIIDGGITLR